jgi:hypothetical protein
MHLEYSLSEFRKAGNFAESPASLAQNWPRQMMSTGSCVPTCNDCNGDLVCLDASTAAIISPRCPTTTSSSGDGQRGIHLEVVGAGGGARVVGVVHSTHLGAGRQNSIDIRGKE